MVYIHDCSLFFPSVVLTTLHLASLLVKLIICNIPVSLACSSFKVHERAHCGSSLSVLQVLQRNKFIYCNAVTHDGNKYGPSYLFLLAISC